MCRSAKPLIEHSRFVQSQTLHEEKKHKESKRKADIQDYAHDILLLIGNRKLCRQIVASSPVTAQAFFEEMVSARKYRIPIGQFVRNISSEAIAQKGSFLYEEADGFTSGLLGYLKPVSQAVYGNYTLVETIGEVHCSPLDIHYEEQLAWDAKQWKAYCRATLMTMESFLKEGDSSSHACTLYRAFDDIKKAVRDTYKLKDMPEMYSSDIHERLRVVVKFAEDAIDLIDKQENPPRPICRVRNENRHGMINIYDYLADMIFDLCFDASSVTSPPDTSWWIQHNLVWSAFFGNLGSDGIAWKIIRHKVRRTLYDEISKLTKFPNYKGARILGFCLQVMGVKLGDNKETYGRNSYALRKAILGWTEKGYLQLRETLPDVAESVLMGSISYDEDGQRLVKTYAKGLKREASKEYLNLSH